MDHGVRKLCRLALVATFVVLCGLPGQAPAQQASVAEHYGNIEYHGPDGTVRQLTQNGNNGEPVLSPDGRTVAFIHQDGKAASGEEPAATSLWVGDGPAGTARQLIGPHSDEDPRFNFASFAHPVFSLDGGYIYVEADAWATSSAVHRVSLKTGREHFVVDGWIKAVIRTGRYRGFLLVGRHMYHPAPEYGAYNPVYVVRPDAAQSFPVPGSDRDDGESSVSRWLRRNVWAAW
jgi:hypothetical protein